MVKESTEDGLLTMIQGRVMCRRGEANDANGDWREFGLVEAGQKRAGRYFPKRDVRALWNRQAAMNANCTKMG
jgi:hypothetical protein